MSKLERLALLAKRKTLFDDRPVEIAELTYVIKQDLSALNAQIGQLQQLSRNNMGMGSKGAAGQENEHNKNVVVLLQGKLADVGANFKEVLEVRTKNIQASRSRTENFVSSVSAHAAQPTSLLDPGRTDSPLYNSAAPSRGRSPKPGVGGNPDNILSLDPVSSSSALMRGPQSDQQILMMEEAQPNNAYIQQRGEAIEAIERTINELGGIFGQLAQMVSEQSEMIQRIDANTEDVVDNVQGAQRELLKYWSRVQGNRWLVAKMFGVLMICKSLSLRFIEGINKLILGSFPIMGASSRLACTTASTCTDYRIYSTLYVSSQQARFLLKWQMSLSPEKSVRTVPGHNSEQNPCDTFPTTFSYW